MRVLVAGPYPPMPSPAARATLALVTGLLRRGEEVEVLSPAPSAAHHHEGLRGVWGALALARRAHAFHAVVLHLERGLPLRPWLLAPLESAALAAALARWRHVTLSLEDLSAVPLPLGGRPARVLLARAQRVVVPTEQDRHRLHDEAGVPLERISLREERPARDAGPGAALSPAGSGRRPASPQELRVALMQRVRAGAARERRRLEAMPPPEDDGGAARPATPAGWAVALAKKGVRRLLGEHADTVLGPLYRLRRAVARAARRALGGGRRDAGAGAGAAGEGTDVGSSVAGEDARGR